MHTGTWWAGVGAVLLTLTLSACNERSPLDPYDPEPPELPPPAGALLLLCTADVRAAVVECGPPPSAPLPPGLSAARIIGGNDVYVRLTSFGTAYDSGTEIFRSTVQVQNLTEHLLGTPDGSTAEGVDVFFHSGPTVTSGTGAVSVENPDGTGTFTASGQPYFRYAGILSPMEISAGREWRFQVDPSVNTFSFLVYVSASMIDETAALLGPVWNGAGETPAWSLPSNWRGEVVPGSTASATIPADSLLGGAPHPVLDADVEVLHLRVGEGTVLNLTGYQLVAGGNVDVLGEVANGTIRLDGDSARVGGRLPALEVRGGAALQRALHTAGPVTVNGSFVTDGFALTVVIP